MAAGWAIKWPVTGDKWPAEAKGRHSWRLFPANGVRSRVNGVVFVGAAMRRPPKASPPQWGGACAAGGGAPKSLPLEGKVVERSETG